MLSYKRTIYKSTCYEVGESVEIYDDHFSPDVKRRAYPREGTERSSMVGGDGGRQFGVR